MRSSTCGRGVLANNCSYSDLMKTFIGCYNSKDRVYDTQKHRFASFSKLMGLFSSVNFFKELFSISCSPLELWMNLTLDFCCCCCCCCCCLEGSQHSIPFLEISLCCLDCLCGLAFKPTAPLLPQDLSLGLLAQGCIFSPPPSSHPAHLCVFYLFPEPSIVSFTSRNFPGLVSSLVWHLLVVISYLPWDSPALGLQSNSVLYARHF